MCDFRIISGMKPAGDQPQAIQRLSEKLRADDKFSVLLGVTGSGKTFTMAHVIANLGKPALVISHNKTLAAQLYEEFRELLPDNAVEYFVSYYDYYQPEAYIPQRDIYIEKDSSRNDDLDRLRLSATASLSARRDAVIVASVSCIFGLGKPEEYKRMMVPIRRGMQVERDELLKSLVNINYERNDVDFKRGTFRVRGDTVELYPAYEQFGYRLEFFGDQVEQIHLIHPTSGDSLSTADSAFIFPAVHYVAPEETVQRAAAAIKEELEMRLITLRNGGKLLEAQRLAARTRYDVEMMLECGYCPGIENYSRHLDGRQPGERPYTLLDYFGDDWLLIIDESHATIPQLKAMYNGDRSRKEVLVEYGFRLPSALDNRPLKFEELTKLWKQVVFVSATPGPYELELTGGEVVEQVIRPTGLVDPAIAVRPAVGQVADLLEQIRQRVAAGERTLITTLTKRLAEDLSEYIRQEGYRCKYLHSEIDTLERVEILKDLRAGEFDVLVGVNLLREGLDLPEVSLVAILDADKEGFLRSETSLIQTIGRCARNVNAQVLLYGDTVTESMRRAIGETDRRRRMQLAFNAEHGITPQTIRKAIRTALSDQVAAHRIAREAIAASQDEFDNVELVGELEREMLAAAEALEFERAAELRDRIKLLKAKQGGESRGADAEGAGGAGREGEGGAATAGEVGQSELSSVGDGAPAAAEEPANTGTDDAPESSVAADESDRPEDAVRRKLRVRMRFAGRHGNGKGDGEAEQPKRRGRGPRG